MKKLAIVFAFASAFLLTATVNSYAQITTPSLSPSAKVEQTVGLTDVVVEYSRPSMRDREIFGGLVPYDQPWRLGANQATKMSFSTDVKLNGAEVAKGDYAVLAKPGMTSWKLMFYPHTGSGSWTSYRDSDVEPVMVSATPQEMPMNVETFWIAFDDLQSEEGTLLIGWDNVVVPVTVAVPTDAAVEASISKTMDGPSAQEYYSAASYYLNADKDPNKALKWINKSIEKGYERFWVMRAKSLIQAKLGDKAGAIESAKRSLEMAEEAGNNDYIKMNKESIAEWMN